MLNISQMIRFPLMVEFSNRRLSELQGEQGWEDEAMQLNCYYQCGNKVGYKKAN
jgi:hypothetical protein